MFFFFSSRRRHTRWNCDWSSDVCSSDLPARGFRFRRRGTGFRTLRRLAGQAARPFVGPRHAAFRVLRRLVDEAGGLLLDRKSTRLNSSHSSISYAVFCLKKKKKNTQLYI